MSFQVIDSLLVTESVRSAVNGLKRISESLNRPSADCVALLMEYKQQLQVACTSVDSGKYPGLLDLVLIFEEGVDLLLARDYCPDTYEVQFLGEFADLFLDYLSMPGSKIAAGILVKHFKKTKWIRPVSLDEHRMLMDYIVQGKTLPEKPVEEMDVVDLGQIDSELDVIEIEPAVEDDAQDDMTLSLEDFIADDKGPVLSAVEIDEDVNEDSQAAEVETISLDQFVSDDDAEEIDLNSFVEDSEAQASEVISLDSFIEASPQQDSEEVSTRNDSTITEPSPVDSSVSEKHHELIGLVCAELEGVEEQVEDLRAQMEADLIHSGFQGLAEEAENIANACSLIGLEGLSQAGHLISTNIQALAAQRDLPDLDTRESIYQWPGLLKACLGDIFNIDACKPLLDYLQQPFWPEVTQSDYIVELEKLLASPSFVDEEVESRQVTATQDDVSLELPDDVNQELLDGLLQDLPNQTSEFSNAIQSINSGEGLDNLEVAQRIAHTLKGAANVVGVRGIANLTHHLEDILEIQAKALKRPGQELTEALLEAADCLEAMSDALMGVDSAPQNALQVLQTVLDWANRLDQQGANAASVTVSPALEETSASGVEATEKPTEPSETTEPREQHVLENMLRVPVGLADELLRLAGENLISTGQIQEHIRNILMSQESIRLHNQALQQLSFDLEHLVDIQGVAAQLNQGQDYSDFDPLEMDQYNEMHSVSRRLVEIAADAAAFAGNLEGQLIELGDLVVAQNQIQKENQDLVLRTRMVAVSTIVQRLKRGVRQACRLTGKKADLVVIENDTMMDSEVLNSLIEPLMHILRNAVDHGIEEARERLMLGKPENGTITLSFDRVGDQIVINVKDDGKGLNLNAIRARAEQRGLLAPNVDMTDEAVARLILENGFSTRDEVTHVSGRGIGLDVVSVKIRELKGSVAIQTAQGEGCDIELRLPVSSYSAHSILVRIREHVYAISNRGIEEILYPGLGEIRTIGEETIFQMDDHAYSAVLIDELLDMPHDRREIDRSTRPVLLVRDDSGARTAILVQDVIDSRDVVVKPLGPYMPKIAGVIGATVLGDGRVASVIDMPEMLLHHAGKSQHTVAPAQHREPEKKRLPYVLVVDDSLSARRSLAQFVQDLGLDVRTARDGMEAVSLIEARRPDLMLVDMEMPRMNGLELTSHIRASSQTNRLPVIMITSRSTDKHKAAALEKGVNHFMVKPFAEDELAQHITDALEEAS